MEQQTEQPEEKQTVLVVDDEATNIKVLSSVLSDEVNVIFATKGETALKLAVAKQPDLVLLDIMMPEMDGYEVCKRLKQDPAIQHIPVIFVTARDAEQDEADGFAAGAIDFITKPFSPLIVMARVRNHLALIGQRNKLRQLSDELEVYRERVAAELASASASQVVLLPDPGIVAEIAAAHKLSIQSKIVPCSELGGDFWGIKDLDEDRFVVLIVDFSGHGINAAINTFRLHTVLNSGVAPDENPAEFLKVINALLNELLPMGQYATMFFGLIDCANDTLTYASAGTPSPLILQPDSGAMHIGNGEGLPVGMFEDSEYENLVVEFPAGSMLLLYSDAVNEGKTKQGDRLGDEPLYELIQEHLIMDPPDQLFDNLIDKFEEIFVHPMADDFSVVSVRRLHE